MRGTVWGSWAGGVATAAGMLALSAAALVASGRPAPAATETGDLTVQAVVKASCDVTGGAVAFGEYVSGQASDLDAVGAITVRNCPNAAVKLELDGGRTGNVNSRGLRARGQAATLRYQLYRDPARTLRWGQGAAAVDLTLGADAEQSVPVFGRVPAAQAIGPGAYDDTIAVTLTF